MAGKRSKPKKFAGSMTLVASANVMIDAPTSLTAFSGIALDTDSTSESSAREASAPEASAYSSQDTPFLSDQSKPETGESAHSTAANIAWALVAGLGWLLVVSGCAAYQFGNASFYRRDLQTIYVPVIRSDSWRPLLGVQATEALQKAIQLRTPYRVVYDPSADSTLTCRVVNDTKRVLTETRTDEPRALETTEMIEVTWVDRQGNLLFENRFLPPGELALLFNQAVNFVPEAGQSMASAQQRAAQQLADEIVSQMEIRW